MGFLTTSQVLPADPCNTEGPQESADSLPSPTNISSSKGNLTPPPEAGIIGCVMDFHVTVTKVPDGTNLRDKYSVSLGPAGREGSGNMRPQLFTVAD